MDIGLALEAAGQAEDNAHIVLSRELVSLLSAQLYQSPIKAIEELVVNSYDADGSNCWVGIGDDRILVLDDGIGMDRAGIQDLWHVGHSSKREEQIIAARKRRQIGKFGIGKLATAAIANRVTYITKAKGAPADAVLTTSVNYQVFAQSPDGGEAVTLKVRRINVDDVLAHEGIAADLDAYGVDPAMLSREEDGWTLALLEDLKPDAAQLSPGRLRWVLSTAMPLVADFSLFLDGEQVQSSKEDADRVVEFYVHELAPERLETLGRLTGETWTASAEEGLTSESFPNGIKGEAFVTRQSLFGNKSDDLSRSHGFFVRVRGRLVNLDDPLFGLKPSSHSILNRFYCEMDADDLDSVLTAPREGVELSEIRRKFIVVLNEIFNQGRSGYEAWERAHKDNKGDPDGKEDKSRENERNYVNPRLVERPIADALLGAAEQAARNSLERRQFQDLDADGNEVIDGLKAEVKGLIDEAAAASKSVAEAGWYYLQLPPDFDLADLTKNLYSDEREESYRYERMSLGRTSPMVRLDPTKNTFQINVEHDMVRAHDDNAASQKLLEDVVTAEALLEVYLREQGMHPGTIEEVLSRRDELLRSLTKDRVYSLSAIAADLRDSGALELELEMQLVIAARALGFLARHIGHGDEPDGIARLMRHPEGEVKITLEAKSSGKDVAGLAAIGFDALEQHMGDYGADGCLLVAPGYPGGTKGDNAAAAKRAMEAKVSCWTVEQLARVVESAQERHFTATKVLHIIQTAFTPDQVSAAIDALFADRGYSDQEIYRAILASLRGLQGVMKGSPRTAEIVLSRVTMQPGFEDVEKPEVERALRDLAGVSGGAMHFDANGSGRVVVHTTLDELERRVSSLLGEPGKPRHAGTFAEQRHEEAEWESGANPGV